MSLGVLVLAAGSAVSLRVLGVLAVGKAVPVALGVLVLAAAAGAYPVALGVLVLAAGYAVSLDVLAAGGMKVCVALGVLVLLVRILVAKTNPRHVISPFLGARFLWAFQQDGAWGKDLPLAFGSHSDCDRAR